MLDAMQGLSLTDVDAQVRQALAEDIGSGDVTTLATVPSDSTVSAIMVAREPLVLAGLLFAERAFQFLSPEVTLAAVAADGQDCPKNMVLLRVSGNAQSILTAERVALNFVQRLSGVATATRRFVEQVAGTKAKILDTRKTTPGWRLIEKYAVRCGGGSNHRTGLYDMVLIKDNHLAALQDDRPNAIESAVRRARAQFPALKIEVEADTLDQVEQALRAGADTILLDNMALMEMAKAVQMVGGRAKTEASGGINLANVRNVAETGVDFISVGAITHSARAVDIALDFQ
jgi:nicotinate-nucleotide pyrophosphorylase (carboxylating)